MSKYRIAFITPTKDRPEELRKMLASLAEQTRCPDQVIVVDASNISNQEVVTEYPNLNISYLEWRNQPSAAAQRNGGIALLEDDINLVCFFDDDQTLNYDALKIMEQFYLDNDTERLAGTAFYCSDYDKFLGNYGLFFKNSRLCKKLGLYASAGRVAKSGWQSMIKSTTENLELEWMSSSAMMLKRDILQQYSFDTFFQGYSYLEDLDFSYSISRRYQLILVAKARFDHFHSTNSRISQYKFGIMEVVNRQYFVRKHQLSIPHYRIGVFIRWCISMATGDLQRSWGNIVALFIKKER